MSTKAEANETQKILRGLRQVVQALRLTARTAEQRHGISAAQLFLLHVLAEHGPASVNELADRTFTHQSSVSVVIARLAASGLVKRGRDAEDGRRATVALAPKGRTLLRRAPEPAQNRLFAALERLEEADRRALARGVGALAREMGVDRGAARMFFEEGGAPVREGTTAPKPSLPKTRARRRSS